MSGRIARWLLQLNELNITVVTPRRLQCQALFDLLAQCSFRECDPLHDDLSSKEICSVEAKERRLAFIA